jgi:DNA-binding transcriptional LysR family regulator
LIELPLGMLTSGMHFRQSIDHNFHSRGLHPQPLLQTDAVHQLLQAVHGGLCCAVMPLDGGLERSPTSAPAPHRRCAHPGPTGVDHAPQRTALGAGGSVFALYQIAGRVLIDAIYR